MLREDLLDLNDILQHPGRSLTVEVSTELEEEEDLDLVTPLDGYLEAISTGNLLLITGDFKTKAVFECSRCAGPIEVEIHFQIDEQFPVIGVPSALSHQDYARVSPDEPFPLFEGNNLMVEALLRQNLLINTPTQPLCSFGWDGDCPIAAERNVIPRDQLATRLEFEKLREIIDPNSEEKPSQSS